MFYHIKSYTYSDGHIYSSYTFSPSHCQHMSATLTGTSRRNQLSHITAGMAQEVFKCVHTYQHWLYTYMSIYTYHRLLRNHRHMHTCTDAPTHAYAGPPVWSTVQFLNVFPHLLAPPCGLAVGPQRVQFPLQLLQQGMHTIHSNLRLTHTHCTIDL